MLSISDFLFLITEILIMTLIIRESMNTPFTHHITRSYFTPLTDCVRWNYSGSKHTEQEQLLGNFLCFHVWSGIRGLRQCLVKVNLVGSCIQTMVWKFIHHCIFLRINIHCTSVWRVHHFVPVSHTSPTVNVRADDIFCRQHFLTVHSQTFILRTTITETF